MDISESDPELHDLIQEIVDEAETLAAFLKELGDGFDMEPEILFDAYFGDPRVRMCLDGIMLLYDFRGSQ